MEKGLDYFEKQYLQYGDCSPNRQGAAFDGENNLNAFCRVENNEAPDLLRKSMERFLIGNVI